MDPVSFFELSSPAFVPFLTLKIQTTRNVFKAISYALRIKTFLLRAPCFTSVVVATDATNAPKSLGMTSGPC
jgi:hypothetical protein